MSRARCTDRQRNSLSEHLASLLVPSLPESIYTNSHVTTPVADQPTTSMLSGHLFVVRGLLESIACDAVIVPTSSSFRPCYTWFSVSRTVGFTSYSNVSPSHPAFPTDVCCRLEHQTGPAFLNRGQPVAIRTHSIDWRRSWSKK